MSRYSYERHAQQTTSTTSLGFLDPNAFTFVNFKPFYAQGIRHMKGLHLGSHQLETDAMKYDLDVVTWPPSARGIRVATLLDSQEIQCRTLPSILREQNVSLLEPFASAFDLVPSFSIKPLCAIQPSLANLAATITYAWLQQGDVNGIMVWPECGNCYTFSEALERGCHAIARSKANTSRLLAPNRSKKSGIASTKADQAVVEKQPSILPDRLPAVLSQRKDLSTSKAQKPYDIPAASLKEENSKLRKRARDVESGLNTLAEKHNHEIANLKQEHTQALRYAKQEHAKQLEKVQQKHKQALSLLEKVRSNEIAPSQERGITGEASGGYFGALEDLILAGIESLMSLMYGKIMSLAKAYSELKREDNKINFVIDDQNARIDKIVDELHKLNMNNRLDQERRQKIELIGRKLWERGISGSNRGTNTEG